MSESVSIPRKVLEDIVDQLDRVLKIAEGDNKNEI